METVMQREFQRGFTVDVEQINRVILGANEKNNPSTFADIRELQRASEKNRVSTKQVAGRNYNHF